MRHRRSWDVTSPVPNTTPDNDATLTFAAQPPHGQPPLMFSAVPPGSMPPADPGYGGYGQQPPPGRPPRKHRLWRWITGTAAALVILIIGGVILAAVTMPSPKGTSQIGQDPPSASSSAPAAAPAPAQAAPLHATRVKFVISGQIPASEFGTVDIEYGSNNHTHDVTLPSLDGKLVYTVRYNPDSDWYSGDVSWSGPGHASVRMVVLSNAGEPLPVAHGDASATGTNGYGDASVQASPNNRAGTSWYDES